MRAKARVNGFQLATLNLTNGLTTDSVKSFGRPVIWSHAGGFLNVTLDSVYNIGEEFDVTVFYHGHPPEGGFQGGRIDSVPVVPVTFNTGQILIGERDDVPTILKSVQKTGRLLTSVSAGPWIRLYSFDSLRVFAHVKRPLAMTNEK